MAPGTHALLGWWTANVLPLSRRDRLLIFLGALLPDLDGLGILVSLEAYVTYHHILCHNLFVGLLWTAVVAVLGQSRRECIILTLLNWHLHLACDYFGSRGPMTTPPWVLPYFYPFMGGWTQESFVGPAWYWNPWQWPLNAWPNTVITLLGIAGWIYIAVRLDRTWFEFASLRFDREMCRMLRRWFGGQASSEWSAREAGLIRGSYLVVAVATLLACVVAGSRATERDSVAVGAARALWCSNMVPTMRHLSAAP